MFDSSPVFTFPDLDVCTITDLYPEITHELNKELRSEIVINHKGINEYQRIFDNFKSIKSDGTEQEIEIAQIEYEKNVKAVSLNITKDIESNFELAIYVNKKIKAQLEPHIDTLFYICIYFYDRYWDTHGLSFNGGERYYFEGKLYDYPEPFEYRASIQLEFISKLLYDYYSKPEAPLSLSIVAGGLHHNTEDARLIHWMIKLIKPENLPSSLGYNGALLGLLLRNKENMDQSDFLIQLKKLIGLEAPTYAGDKRKVVKTFCLAIHKIFSFYLGLPTKSFDGKRLTIYNNILKSFQMDDFGKRIRNNNNLKKKRGDHAENNLRTLLSKDKMSH